MQRQNENITQKYDNMHLFQLFLNTNYESSLENPTLDIREDEFAS